MTDHDALLVVVAELGADELRVLRLLADRLLLGARQYGALDLAGDRRDLRHEATQEALDLACYLAMRLVR